MGTIYPTVPVARPPAEPWPDDDRTLDMHALQARQLGNDLATELAGLREDLMGRSGEDALVRIGEVTAQLPSLRERYLGQAAGPLQRGLFEPEIDMQVERFGAALGGIAGRANTELEDRVHQDTVTGLVRDGVASAGDLAQLYDRAGALVHEVKRYGTRRAWDDDTIRTRAHGRLTDLYAGAVDAELGRDPDAAQRLFDHAREIFDAPRQAAIEKRLSLAYEDRRVAGVAQALRDLPLDPGAPPDPAALAARAAELTPDDASEEAKSRIAQAALDTHRILQRQWDKRQADAGIAAFQIMSGNPDTPPDLLPSVVREWLSPEQRQGLRRWAETGRLQSDPDLYERLERVAIYEPRDFTAAGLSGYRLMLNDRDYGRLELMHKAIADGRPSAEAARSMRGRVGADRLLTASGIDLDSAEAGLVRANVQRSIDSFEAIEGRPASGADIDVIVEGEIAGGKPPFYIPRPPYGPSNPAPRYKEPIPGQSGKKAKDDIPQWAQGQRPRVGEDGKTGAGRVMDEKYGPDNWAGKPERQTEFSQIRKYFDSHFREPRPPKPGLIYDPFDPEV